MATSSIAIGKTTGPIRFTSTLGLNQVTQSPLCTVDAGQQVTLKYIKATNLDPTTVHYLCIAIGTDISSHRIIDQEPVPGGNNGSFERFVTRMLKSADVLCASADTDAKINLTIEAINERTP